MVTGGARVAAIWPVRMPTSTTEEGNSTFSVVNNPLDDEDLEESPRKEDADAHKWNDTGGTSHQDHSKVDEDVCKAAAPRICCCRLVLAVCVPLLLRHAR